MSLIKLTKYTYLLRGSPITLIKILGYKAYVVDPGSSNNRGLELRGLLSNKFSVSKVITLITHHHSDHIYALTTLKPDETYVPYGEELLITNKAFRAFLDYSLDLTSIDVILSNYVAPDISLDNVVTVEPGDEVNGFKVIDLKGHTYGHVGYSIDDEVLYVGDALFGDKLLERVKVPYLNDFREFIDTLGRIKELVTITNYKYVVLSHGPLINRLDDLIKLIDVNLKYLINVKESVISVLREFRSLEQLTSLIITKLGIDESLISYLLTYTTLRAILNDLIRDGKVVAGISNGQLLFKVKEL